MVSGVSETDASSGDADDPLHLGYSWSLWVIQSISRISKYLLELEMSCFSGEAGQILLATVLVRDPFICE